MAKFAQGPYTVKNAQKYVGKGTPRYRSSWEWALRQTFVCRTAKWFQNTHLVYLKT